jgi:hypothetical protein
MGFSYGGRGSPPSGNEIFGVVLDSLHPRSDRGSPAQPRVPASSQRSHLLSPRHTPVSPCRRQCASTSRDGGALIRWSGSAAEACSSKGLRLPAASWTARWMTPIRWPLETASAGPSVSTGNRPRRVSDGRGSRQPRSIALMSRAGLLPHSGQPPARRNRQPRLGDCPGAGVGFTGSPLMWRI